MVQTKMTDYLMTDTEEVPPPRNILINGDLRGSRSLLDNKMFYLESKYEPVMVTYEDSIMFVLCCLNMNTGEEVMVHYYQNFCRNRDTVWKIIRELQTAKYLHHPNIMQYESMGIPIISNNEEENCQKVAGRLFEDFYLVYKSAGFENLQSFLSTGRSIVNIPKMIFQVLSTLKFLHDSVGILHHGLSLSHIFLSTSNQNVKLAGFSSSHLIGEEGDILEDLIDSSSYPRKQLCHLAPEELLMCVEFTSSPSIDIWYLGCILVEFILGWSPFILPDNVDLTKELQLERILEALKPECDEFSFIRCGRCKANMLAQYAESSKNTHPTFLDIVGHSCPWVAGLVTNMLFVDPNKRYSIDLAIEYVRTNESIMEEDFEEKFDEYMEDDVANTSEVIEDEEYFRRSQFQLCDEQQLRDIIWTEVAKYHQRS